MGKVFLEIKKKSNKQYILKILGFLSFILIFLALILIDINSPAKGYEISVYTSLPRLIWIFLILAAVTGIGIIVHQAFTSSKNNLWSIGFLILIITDFIILSLQFFRNYYISSYSDPMYHLYLSSVIASEGSIGGILYPVTHILGAIFIEICNLSPEIVIKYIPVIFTILFIFFTYLLSTVVSFKREQAVLTSACSTILLFSYYHIAAYPHALSLLSFPLFFYVYFKSSNNRSLNWRIPLIILLFIFPFFHPITEITIIFCLIIGEIMKLIWVKRTSHNIENMNITINLFFISLATFFLWIYNFSTFIITTKYALKWPYGEPPVYLRKQEIKPIFALELEKQIEIFIKMYGHNFIFVSLSLIALLITIIYFFKRKKGNMNLFVISMLFISSQLIYSLIFLNIPFMPWGRALGANVGMWATPVLIGFVLYKVFKRFRKTGIIITSIILFFTFIISIFGIYRSPWIHQPNWQITQMDLKGSNWFNLHKNEEFQYSPMGWSGGYYHWYYHFPSNFGYPEYKSIGEYIKKETYIALTERFIQALSNQILKEWINISPDLARSDFNRSDFDMLEKDFSVNKIYSNKEFRVLLVLP